MLDELHVCCAQNHAICEFTNAISFKLEFYTCLENLAFTLPTCLAAMCALNFVLKMIAPIISHHIVYVVLVLTDEQQFLQSSDSTVCVCVSTPQS